MAKGPLAPLYLAHTRSDHDWRSLLASPRENTPLTDDQTAEQTKWTREYAARQADAKKSGQPIPVEFPPESASAEWAKKIADDWRTAVIRFTAIEGVTVAQKEAAEKALAARLNELATYIRGAEQDIAEYRHDLWRLANWRQSPEAGDVPFVKQRIATKSNETSSAVVGWREETCIIEDGLRDDLNDILTDEQRTQSEIAAAMDNAVADENQHKLDFVNSTAMIVTIGVGLCLIFGLFTRLAAIVGALFLFGVIASQPFWITGAAPTMNQCVELAALLVLAGAGAGRWAGMDGCLAALFGRRRTLTVQEN
jgi:uncharacterized membrane protein YphA (DoxX/SURF4 family)